MAIYMQASQKMPLLLLTDQSWPTESQHRTDEKLAAFWKGMNQLRENWRGIGAQIVFLLSPDSYHHLTVNADHLKRWISLKLHFKPMATPFAHVMHSGAEFIKLEPFGAFEILNLSAARQQLEILMLQLAEAKSRGEPEPVLVRRYYLPLFAAAVSADKWAEADEFRRHIQEKYLRLEEIPQWRRLSQICDQRGTLSRFDVFLSHNSKDKPAVRALAALLSERGIKVWLDEEQLIPGRPWQPLLEEGIKESATGAVLVGADGVGPWEDEEMRALLDLAVRKKKPVIPVLLPGAPERPVLPTFLSNRTWVDLRAGFIEDKLAKLTWGITGKKPDSTSAIQQAPDFAITVARLRHGADQLVGREKELARIDAAWHDPKTHVVTIVAWGGVGKTALVVEWMARMARDGWRGAERVFDWSFYSQGTREQGAASADTFIAKALEFFGDPEMAKSAAAAWDKGSRLAQLVAQKRTLLVLDGVEPLQYPPGPVGGQLKDPALEALLKGLAQHNPGLCIVTTREPVTDLRPFRDTTSPEWLLEHLSEEAGAHLLFETGVTRAGNAQIRADDKELKDAAREVGGHALTLQLLGRYLAKVHNGDVRKRDLVRFEKADARVQGGHAFKVMAVYEKWLGKGGEDALRQLAVLRLLGLFDRPADPGCLAALRKEPVIAGLTEPLVGLDHDDWNYSVSNLVECGLISLHASDSPTTDNRLPTTILDAHPLIREYFAKQLREKSPDAWRAAHRRLYEYLCATTKEGDQPTLEDLQPLYQAVAHGCQAGMQQEACEDVYVQRITRGEEKYVIRKLGALAADLGAVAAFFEQPWTRVSPSLPETHQAWLLNQAAFRLCALGRLTEALEPTRVGLENYLKQEDWGSAARLASTLCELELTLGEVAQAKGDAEKSVVYADRSGEWNWRRGSRSTLADILHQAGHADNALASSQDAESIQAENEPNYPLLYSLEGFRYCDLLLATSERGAWGHGLQVKTENRELQTVLEACLAVEQRSAQTLKWAEQARGASLLDMALDHLMLGRAALYRAVLTQAEIQDLKSEIEQAVAGLRFAGQPIKLPLGLLTRAWLRFLERDADGARADLDEAWEIAERGPMRLFLADIHLYRARLFHAVAPYPWDKDEQGKPRGPKDDLAAARKLIERCGYHRRDEELADAEEAAKGW